MTRLLKQGLIHVAYRLPVLPRRQLLYLIHQGRWARLRNPQLMTEKVNWRILYDRRRILMWTCDKLQMKTEAQRLCPEINVPRTYWAGEDVAELVGVELPDAWVLKPNLGSGLVYYGRGPVTDVDALRKITKGWLKRTNVGANGEWAYRFARRTLLVEQALGEPGQSPTDYKFYVFDGVVRLIQVDRARFSEEHSRRHYDADWSPIDLMVKMPTGEAEPKPAQLPRMLEMAAAVAKPFEFMRVDLYLVDDEVYLGEVTPYPGSGFGRYEPRSVDVLMGSYWTLPVRSAVRG